MNKLLGFFDLKDSNLPTIDWNLFDEKTPLFDSQYAWTIRTAVVSGNDFNLPRLVGVDYKEAYEFALNLYKDFKDKGIIIYYPYFIAEKSGTIEITSNKIVIEAVNGDLWNLVTYNKKNVTVINDINGQVSFGDSSFLIEDELNELLAYCNNIRQKYREYIYEGKSVLLEWSFAFNTTINKIPLGKKSLIFYEVRTI